MPTLKAQSQASVVTATGRTWQQWSNELSQEKFKGLSCDEVENELTHGYEIDWQWARKITARFSRSHDLLARNHGDQPHFDITVRKTFHLPKAEVLKHVHEWLINENRAGNTRRVNHSRINCQWTTDDSHVALSVHEKDGNRSQVTLHHERIRSRNDAEIMRTFWKEQIKGMAEAL